MTQRDKLIQKFLKNPTSVKYAELVSILKHFGFEQIPAKGSHVKFKHSKLTSDLIIPVHRGDCKDFYKTLARKIIEQIM